MNNDAPRQRRPRLPAGEYGSHVTIDRCTFTEWARDCLAWVIDAPDRLIKIEMPGGQIVHVTRPTLPEPYDPDPWADVDQWEAFEEPF